MIRKLRNYWRLEPDLRRMALEAVVLQPLVTAAFVLVGTPTTASRLAAWTRARRDVTPTQAAALMSAAVHLQGRIRASFGIGGTCLVRSLVLQAVLGRRGVATELRIGVRKVGGVAEGHAWVEYEGHPINESVEVTATYAVFEGAVPETWR